MWYCIWILWTLIACVSSVITALALERVKNFFKKEGK